MSGERSGNAPMWVNAPHQFLALLEAAGIGLWEYDHATDFFAASLRTLALYGLPADTPPAEAFARLTSCVHPDDVAGVQEASRIAFLEGRTSVVDYRIRRGDDGAERWLRARALPGRAPGGQRGLDMGVLVDVTDERRQALQLVDKRHELDRAQQIAGIGSFTWDVVRNEVSWSDETFRLLGIDPSAGHAGLEPFLAMLAPEDAERFMAGVNLALLGEAPFDMELPVRRPDGRTVLVHDRAEVERDASGAPLRMTGTKQDVTAQREAEARLRRTARELARAQRMARLGSWSWDLRDGGIWWSPEVWALFEIDAAVAASVEALRAIFPVTEQARYDAAFERALREGAPYEVEVSTRLPSGRELTVRALGEIERLDDGTPVAIHGAVQDITEQRQRERAVREGEQVFRTLATSGSAGVFRSDATGRTTYANQRLLDLWHMSFEELVEGWAGRVHPEDAAMVAAADRAAVDFGKPFRAQYRLVVDGEIRHVRVTSSPVLDDGISYGGQVGVVEDITEEVLARERHERFEAEVRDAQKLESLGVLAGGIAHDFNNLLVGVLSNASLALEALPRASAVHELVSNIERAAQRAADLTRQLLAYSGRGRLVVGPVDLSEVVREMADLLRTVVSKRARIVLDLGRGLPAIEGDATQLRQVVMNLITNASDALGDRDGTITLRTRPSEPADVSSANVVFGVLPDASMLVTLEVTDDGSGMDEATWQRIFDPFFTTKFTGRGLGLSAAQGIVRGHHGVITLRSSPGAGTRFMVILPAGGRPTSPDATPVVPPVRLGHGRILVVDDDESVRTVLARMLRGRAFTVDLVENGQAALDLVRARPDGYAAVLLDLTMPVMNGRDTFEALSAMAPALPIVMMSGYSEEEMGTGGTRAPAGTLPKPFTASDVFVVLDRVLGTARGA